MWSEGSRAAGGILSWSLFACVPATRLTLNNTGLGFAWLSTFVISDLVLLKKSKQLICPTQHVCYTSIIDSNTTCRCFHITTIMFDNTCQVKTIHIWTPGVEPMVSNGRFPVLPVFLDAWCSGVDRKDKNMETLFEVCSQACPRWFWRYNHAFLRIV